MVAATLLVRRQAASSWGSVSGGAHEAGGTMQCDSATPSPDLWLEQGNCFEALARVGGFATGTPCRLVVLDGAFAVPRG